MVTNLYKLVLRFMGNFTKNGGAINNSFCRYCWYNLLRGVQLVQKVYDGSNSYINRVVITFKNMPKEKISL